CRIIRSRIGNVKDSAAKTQVFPELIGAPEVKHGIRIDGTGRRLLLANILAPYKRGSLAGDIPVKLSVDIMFRAVLQILIIAQILCLQRGIVNGGSRRIPDISK